MAEPRAWAFPVDVDENGQVKEVSGADAIRQSIMILLSTHPGERILHREYGVALRQFMFGVMDYTTLKLIENTVRTAIERWEKRVNLISVEATPKQNRILIDVKYEYNEQEYQYTHILNE